MRHAVIAVMIVAVLGICSAVMAEEAGLGGEIYFTKPVKSVLFSHKMHVDDLSMSCNLCHDKLFQMSALDAQNNADFNHKGFKAGKYCGACHDGKSGFSAGAQCTKCHLGVKGYNKAQKQEKAKQAQGMK
jgi:c(7)-type cytochrome triheme protein